MATRTTITIDEDLLDRIKVRAARERTTVSSMIEEELRVGKVRRVQRESSGGGRFRLPTFDLGEQKPAVDMTDNAALRDLMDDIG